MIIDRCPLDSDEKRRMIAQNAYFRFAERGFTEIDPMRDWLDAEAEIERAIREQCRQSSPRGLTSSRRRGWFETASEWWHRVRPKSDG